MIPLDRFRELLGPECDLDDEEVRKLRRQMHVLAEIIVDAASATLGSEIREPEAPDRPAGDEDEDVN